MGASDLPRAAVWVGTQGREREPATSSPFSYIELFLSLFLFQYSNFLYLRSKPCSLPFIPEAAGQPWREAEHELMISPD